MGSWLWIKQRNCKKNKITSKNMAVYKFKIFIEDNEDIYREIEILSGQTSGFTQVFVNYDYNDLT